MASLPPAYTGEAPYVFVCYSHEDKKAVFPEILWLQEQGIHVWYDEGISPGHEWSEELGRAIDRARSFLFFVTPASVASKHCRNEVHYAQGHDIPVLALHLQPTRLPPGLELALSSSQAVLAHELTKPAYRDKMLTALAELRPGTAMGRPQAAARKLRHGSRTRLAVALAAALALSGFGAWLWYEPDATAPGAKPEYAIVAPEKSIAILPFDDMSENKDQAHLADGMAEEVINLLARVPGLLVPARTSSFYFKGTATPIAEIAQTLGVSRILQGSIRRAGDQLRVTAQLVEPDNGYVIWSQRYDRELRDVFLVQDEIASAVVQALRVNLMGGELSRNRGGTENLKAYELYLKGTQELNENSSLSLEAAEAYMEKAIAIDPTFGRAWSGLAAVVIGQTDNGFVESRSGYERARELAGHALQVSPDLADAHTTLQYVHRTLDWNWKASAAEGKRARALEPFNLNALMISGMLAYTLGQWHEAEGLLTQLLARDPFNSYANWNLGTTYYGAGRYKEAERVYRHLLEIAPSFLWTRGYLGKTLLAAGDIAGALETIEQDPSDEMQLMFLPAVLHAAGRKAESDNALEAQIARWAAIAPYHVAQSYAYRGETDQAFEWLERAYRQRDYMLVEIVGEPLFRNVWADPRFKAFLVRMNLPHEWLPRPESSLAGRGPG